MLLNFISSLTSLVLFLNSFIPFRYNNANFTEIEFKNDFDLEFNRTVIMVIDALRYDFLNEEYMPLTWKLIEKYGCLMDVEVASPTVTLPRIKSLTTGTVPLFTDLIYNIGNPQLVEDSLLHSAKKQNKKVVFFGDDTWLKMFPDEIYERKEGTTSFFVNDFHEVDDNVTRNVDVELKKNDWNIMILHYLGLDHIGHVHGPFSPLISTKLQEMDQIFQRIFQEISVNSNYLLILTGDHGMKDSGGHGGSTYPEKHVPLVMLGTKCENSQVNQVDITANLALLLNLQIPSNSIGKLDRNFLKNLTMKQYLSALQYNSEILKTKHDLCNSKFEQASKCHQLYVEKGDLNEALKSVELYEKCSFELSNFLIETSVTQYVISMITSIIYISSLLLIHIHNAQIFIKNFTKILFYAMMLFSRIFLPEICAILVGISVFLFGISKSHLSFSSNSFVILAFLIQPLTWFSSSFIEEEHEYWYFIMNSIFIALVIMQVHKKNLKNSINFILILILVRSSQTLNQTGDKWAALPDTSDFLKAPENSFLYSTLITVSIIGLSAILYSTKRKCTCLEIAILILICVLKLQIFQDQIRLVRFVYFLILSNLILSRDILKSWVFLVCLVYKPYNLFLVPITLYTSHIISEAFKDKKLFVIYFHVLLSKCMFFMQGNGNSLSNVDVTVGYMGLSSYNSIIVGFQILVNIYSSLILIHMLIIETSSSVNDIFDLLYIERLYCVVIFTMITLVFKNHISVWTIYAPKLLIECIHTVIFFLEVIIFKLFVMMRHLYENNTLNVTRKLINRSRMIQ